MRGKIWAAAVLLTASVSQAAITWTTLEDYTGTISPSQNRSLRGLALSDNDLSVYGGFIQGTSSSSLHKVNVASPTGDVVTTIANSRQPKAIATDDRGNVYSATAL